MAGFAFRAGVRTLEWPSFVVDVGPRPAAAVVTGLATSALDLDRKLLAVWVVVATATSLLFDLERDAGALTLVTSGTGCRDVPTF